MATQVLDPILKTFETARRALVDCAKEQATTIARLIEENASLRAQLEQAVTQQRPQTPPAVPLMQYPFAFQTLTPPTTPPLTAPPLGISTVLQNKKEEIVFVGFKRNRVFAFSAAVYFAVGTPVIVSIDRGEDVGIVSSKDFHHTVKDIKGHVLRAATKEDLEQMVMIENYLEARCLDVCRLLVSRKKLPMEVNDVAVQFDRKKISFFFTSGVRIDFRALVAELYQLFGCRIWMEKYTPL